jgi:hypothetical protein
MGYYRGVPQDKRGRLEKLAAKMREKYLNTGSGCKSQAKAIARRQEGA